MFNIESLPYWSLIISIVALIYTFASSTKRYELSNEKKLELLEWNKENLVIMTNLRMGVGVKSELLAKLSAQIDIGRFYFPNIIRDDFGIEKPKAYRGYRNIILDLLVASYNLIFELGVDGNDKHLEKLQRLYVSYMFDVIDPKNTNKTIKKLTGIKFNENFSVREFSKQNPANYSIIAPYNRENLKSKK